MALTLCGGDPLRRFIYQVCSFNPSAAWPYRTRPAVAPACVLSVLPAYQPKRALSVLPAYQPSKQISRPRSRRAFGPEPRGTGDRRCRRTRRRPSPPWSGRRRRSQSCSGCSGCTTAPDRSGWRAGTCRSTAPSFARSLGRGTPSDSVKTTVRRHQTAANPRQGSRSSSTALASRRLPANSWLRY